jgi:hypothetical protein
MHGSFGAAAVLDQAERAQQEAAQHFVQACGAPAGRRRDRAPVWPR